MSVPLVTCIITSYNKLNYLFEAIDSVLMQDYPRIELIVTDDGSERFEVKDFEDYISKRKGSNIETAIVLKQDTNVGTVSNMNTALRQSSGDYYICLDGDDVFYDEHVFSRIVDRFTSTGYDFLACSRVKCDLTLHEIAKYPNETQINEFISLSCSREQLGQFCVFNFMEVDAHVFSKKVVQELGEYNEQFRQWQDGPRLTEYVSRGNMIHQAFDITLIKYREGGVSSSPSRNAISSSHLAKDKHRFVELYMIKNKECCNHRQFNRNMVWYLNEKRSSKMSKLLIFLKYPIECGRILLSRLKL